MPDPDPQRVLIVRPSALGDVARTVPVAVAIKREWPSCHLTWLVNRPFAAAIEHHPAVDDVIPFHRDRLGNAWKLSREVAKLARILHGRRFDRVYDLQGLARSGIQTIATRARRRVGFADARELGWLGYNVRHTVVRDCEADAEDIWTVQRRRGASVVIAGPGEVGDVWALRSMLGLLHADGIPVPQTLAQVAGDLGLAVDPQARASTEAWAREQGLHAGAYLVVAPTAQWGCKCWPVERFAQVAAELVQARGHGLDPAVVAVGAPHEAQRIESFRAELRTQGIASVWPQTDVAGLMAVLASARLVLANDSAPLHLAVGLGVPTVSVFGPTDPALVGPWGYALWPATDRDASGRSKPPDDTRHWVVRAARAADGATDYRRQRDDDTLIATVSTPDVAAAAAFLLHRTGVTPTH
ncbi:MAG: glycosyltransferase family 9 protein [Planctomycetota bacterium]